MQRATFAEPASLERRILDKHLGLLAKQYFTTRFFKVHAPVRRRVLLPQRQLASPQASLAFCIALLKTNPPAVTGCAVLCAQAGHPGASVRGNVP